MYLQPQHGRAAKRITETTGKKAKTLHRLLELTKIDDRDFDSYIDVDVKSLEQDYIIVDEASMIDTLMMNNIVKSISSSTRVILVGDINQLPSVGPGAILKDIIDSGKVPTIFLKHIYRQSLQSDIIVNAHRVNEGKQLEFKTGTTDLYYIKVESEQEALEQMSSLLSHRIQSFAKLNIVKDLQVLTPTKKRELGTSNLNKEIQELLNKNNDITKTANNRTFKIGDKVMQIINNYDREYEEEGTPNSGVFNGDIGYVTDIDTLEEYVEVTFDDTKITKYDFSDLEELEHAYAITIHKSQGSEYDYVIIPLFKGYTKLYTRNLLYTAMTRAKKMLILIGNRATFQNMINNIEENNRKTGLKFQIVKLYENQKKE